MSVNLVNHYVSSFSTNIALLLQQKGSRLRPFVTEGSYVGKQASPVDQIAAVNAQKVVSRFAPMGRVDAAVDRRWVVPVDYDLPQLIDSFDKLRLLTDPESAYVMNAMYAMGRAMDDELISAFFGTAKTGETGAGSTAFGAAQFVSVNTGGATSNLNFAKIRAARKILMANEVDFDNDPVTMAVTATEYDSLFGEAQVINRDYSNAFVLEDGKIKKVLGINIVQCERLTTGTDDAAGTSRAIPVWAKSGMHLGMWGDLSVDISQRKDLQSLPWQAYVKGSFGATRIEEKKVVRIWAR